MSIRNLAINPLTFALFGAAHAQAVHMRQVQEKRLRDAGLDPAQLLPVIEEYAQSTIEENGHVIAVLVYRCIEAVYRKKDEDERARQAEMHAALATIKLTATPRIQVRDWMPPPRRASKRAQRQRERPWAR